MTPRHLIVPALLLAGAALPWGAAQAQEGRTIVIFAELHETQYGLHMVPERIDAQAGDTLSVEVVNRGEARHNLIFCGDEAAGSTCQDKWAATRLLATNETETITVAVEEAGTFAFYCDLPGHRQGGMKGELIVQGAPADKKSVPAPGLALALLAVAGALALVSRRGSP